MSLIIKLHIEMAIAGFIAKIIRSAHQHEDPANIEGAVEFGPHDASTSESIAQHGSGQGSGSGNRSGQPMGRQESGGQLPAAGEEIGPDQHEPDLEMRQLDRPRSRRPSRLKKILTTHSEAP